MSLKIQNLIILGHSNCGGVEYSYNTLLVKKNIKDYYFEKGEMILNDHNISDIVFLKKNV